MDARRITNHRSVPILKVSENIGLLPLLVEINETIIQDVLRQSLEEAYAHLVIDLSGTPSLSRDLSKLLLGLDTIGVDVITSGLPYEKISQGGMIPFDAHRCFPDLYQALISLDVPMEPREAER